MGAAPSHEPPPPPPRRPGLGPRPTNVRALSPTAEAAALPAALFRDNGRPARDLRPIEYRPPVQQSEIVRNVVNLNKATLKLVRGEGSMYLVEFEFDADVGGFITIFYSAKEVVQRQSGKRGKDAPVVKVSYFSRGELPGRTAFGVGRKQRYRQKMDKGLDVGTLSSQEMTYKAESDRYPVVIRLEAVYPADSAVPNNMRVKSQTTFASVVQVGEEYRLQMIAQQVLLGGTIYRMRDLYGIGAADVTATRHDADDQEEYRVDTTHDCVICLTEPCNTAVLPCNHLCLCDDCARILCTEMDYQRRKCPVCRTPLASLLRIISGPNDDSSAEAGSTIPDTAAATVARTVSDVPSVAASDQGSDTPEASQRDQGNTLIV